MTERLYRHPTDRAIAGVAGGLAAWLNIDPSLVRIAWVLLALFTGGAFVLVYIVMMIVVPLPPPGWAPRPRGTGPGSASGWGPPPGGWGASPSGGWGTPGSTTWGPAAAPGGAPSPAPSWGEAPQGGWGDPSAPAPGTAPGQGAAPDQGHIPGWGTNTAPSASWPTPKPGSAGIVAGVVLVLLGVWFLVDQFVTIDWDLLWPVIIMVVGGGLIAGALMRSRDT